MERQHQNLYKVDSELWTQVVKYEPGDHLSSDKEFADFVERIQEGDLYNTHIWLNGEIVAGRMREYGPNYIASDGLVPTVKNKQQIWTRLPDTPSSIRPNDPSIYVVSGDPAISELEISSNSTYNEEFRRMVKEMDKNFWISRRLDDDLPASVVENIPFIASGAITYSLIALASLNIERKNKSENKLNRISRREFIGLAAGYGFSFGIVVMGGGRMVGSKMRPEVKASYSKTNKQKEHWLRVNSLVQSVITAMDEVDARTAGAVLKSKDAMERGGENDAIASVLMGYSHSRRAMRMVEDYLYSERMAGRYFKQLQEVVIKLDPPSSLQGMPPEEFKSQVMDNLRSFIVGTLVHKVDEPRSVNGYPSNEEVLNSISLVDAFDSPSVNRVWEKYVNN